MGGSVPNAESTAKSAQAGAVPGRSAARLTADAVLQWATDRRRALSGRVVMVTEPDDITETAGLLGPDDIVVASYAHGRVTATGGPTMCPVDGALIESGDVIRFGEGYELELQDYLAIAFLPITRPTVARIADEEGWAALLADADEARRSGYVIPQLLNRNVVLFDEGFLAALTEPTPATPTRFHVHPDSTVSVGIDGTRLGRVGEIGRTALAQARTSASAVGGITATDAAADLAQRPWFGRYLAARSYLGETETSWWVSGFGRMLLPHLVPSATRRGRHLLLNSTARHLLVEIDTRRRFELSVSAAEAVEALLETGDVDRAADAVAQAHPFERELRGRIETFAAALARAGIEFAR